MNRNVYLAVCIIALGLAAAWFFYQHRQETQTPEPLVFAGDSKSRVLAVLGEPNIEFPNAGTLVQWFDGYEIILSNDVVIEVEMTPLESEEERLDRELSVQEDEKRLKEAYEAVIKNEQISYAAWLDREALRLEQQRQELAKIKAYEQRRSEERKAAIRAEAIRRSRRHYHY